MENLIVFIKLNRSAEAVRPAISYLESSWAQGRECFYYTNGPDTELIRELLETLELGDLAGRQIVFLLFRNPERPEIEELFVGRISRVEQGESTFRIFYRISSRVRMPLVIDNFMSFSNLDISRDFDDNSHISAEDSPALRRQLAYITDRPRGAERREAAYLPLPQEEGLSDFAQRNEDCRRFHNFLPPSAGRGEFQRDYDRIVHSKAFRRMVDKAQIFTSSKGDHYRTRMTHTLGVAQIARSIASRLNMNVALTEAIALGHDLGHTPFGHQGERTLDRMSRQNGAGGFKHNYQSLKVASELEEEYIECSGLDLSVQVLEGMWKHTRIRKRPGEPLLCTLRDFLPPDLPQESADALWPEQDFCSTVEGQIVCIADEIAQRSHDLDDAFSAGLLSVEGLLEALSLKKLHTLKRRIEDLQRSVQEAMDHSRVFISAEEVLACRISSEIINYFIGDVVRGFRELLEGEALEDLRRDFAESRRIHRKVIDFTAQGRVLNNYLETIVTKQVINSPEVAAFDDKADRIVASLFQLYYDNPRLLHEGTLQRIYIRTRMMTENVIHFQEGDIDLVNGEWARIKDPENAPRLRDLKADLPGVELGRYESIEDLLKDLPEGSERRETAEAYCQKCREEYREKKKILIRAICDFISGMTDSYATREYQKMLC